MAWKPIDEDSFLELEWKLKHNFPSTPKVRRGLGGQPYIWVEPSPEDESYQVPLPYGLPNSGP